jgi:hypothetical protein
MQKTYLVVIIIIILVGGGFWWWQQSTDITSPNNEQTKNWQTSQSNKGGFELQHPPIWNIQNNDNGSINITIPNEDNRPLLTNLGTIGINIQETKNNGTLLQQGRDSLLKPWRDELGIEKDVPEKTTSSNGNVITFLGPLSPPSGMNDKIYAVVSSETKTAIMSGTIFGGSEELLDTINQVLKTVKFTNDTGKKEMESSRGTTNTLSENTTSDSILNGTYQSQTFSFEFKNLEGWSVKTQTLDEKLGFEPNIIRISLSSSDDSISIHIMPKGGFNRGLPETIGNSLLVLDDISADLTEYNEGGYFGIVRLKSNLPAGWTEDNWIQLSANNPEAKEQLLEVLNSIKFEK